MTPKTPLTRDANGWANWFWGPFFADWVDLVQDEQGGVFDVLEADGTYDATAGKSLLTQARTLFTLSHVALQSGDPKVIKAAARQVEILQKFRRPDELYRCKLNRDGTQSGKAEDEVARSYDQTFVILGLVTWNCIAPSAQTAAQVEACWTAIQTYLTDPTTGLLLNDDTGANTGPAQNPHMHLYEACLQAFRMNGAKIWLDRAAQLRSIGLQYFMDQDSGSIAEFLTPDLRPLPDGAGQRREIGHQCEWSWLLWEEAHLAQDPKVLLPAKRLFDFADRFGFAEQGDLTGAVFDAVSTNGAVIENSHLLWPQTEAIKLLAVGDSQAGERACALLCLMFERWFEGHRTFVNQLDSTAKPIWPQALTRLMYHVVIAMSEGARAGLWDDVPSHKA